MQLASVQRRLLPIIRVVVAGACIWLLVGTVRIYPYYLAFFNEIIGGPANGYKYLLDSNVDWGQDLKGLAAFMRQRGIQKITLAYHGPPYIDPRAYGIDYTQLQPGTPTSGIIAISAQLLRGITNDLACTNAFVWLESFEPVATIGYSIFVFTIPSFAKLPPPIALPDDCVKQMAHPATVP